MELGLRLGLGLGLVTSPNRPGGGVCSSGRVEFGKVECIVASALTSDVETITPFRSVKKVTRPVRMVRVRVGLRLGKGQGKGQGRHETWRYGSTHLTLIGDLEVRFDASRGQISLCQLRQIALRQMGLECRLGTDT